MWDCIWDYCQSLLRDLFIWSFIGCVFFWANLFLSSSWGCCTYCLLLLLFFFLVPTCLNLFQQAVLWERNGRLRQILFMYKTFLIFGQCDTCLFLDCIGFTFRHEKCLTVSLFPFWFFGPIYVHIIIKWKWRWKLWPAKHGDNYMEYC